MRWMVLAASAAIVAGLWLPGEAAQPTATAAPAAAAPGAAPDTITFEQYRDWRNNFIERRRDQLTAQLAAADLSADRKSRLLDIKSYYDWLAGLPAADRDRRYRQRFDQIDANHDGIIDPAERSAWHDKQRTRYAHFRPRADDPADPASRR